MRCDRVQGFNKEMSVGTASRHPLLSAVAQESGYRSHKYDVHLLSLYNAHHSNDKISARLKYEDSEPILWILTNPPLSSSGEPHSTNPKNNLTSNSAALNELHGLRSSI